MAEGTTARIAVVDPQPLFSRGLTLLLPAVSDGRVEVVATASDAGEAAALVRRCRPDVALVDLGLGPPGGLRAIAAIRRTEPGVAVVAMSAFPAEGRAQPALQAGARGFLCKTAEPESLLLPLLAVVEGWAVVPPQTLAQLSATAGGNSDGSSHRLHTGLDDGDRRLWQLLATGRTLADIAEELHVSERTTKRLTAALLRRLKVSSRNEAAALAGRCGLLDDAADGQRNGNGNGTGAPPPVLP